MITITAQVDEETYNKLRHFAHEQRQFPEQYRTVNIVTAGLLNGWAKTYPVEPQKCVICRS